MTEEIKTEEFLDSKLSEVNSDGEPVHTTNTRKVSLNVTNIALTRTLEKRVHTNFNNDYTETNLATDI